MRLSRIELRRLASASCPASPSLGCSAAASASNASLASLRVDFCLAQLRRFFLCHASTVAGCRQKYYPGPLIPKFLRTSWRPFRQRDGKANQDARPPHCPRPGDLRLRLQLHRLHLPRPELRRGIDRAHLGMKPGTLRRTQAKIADAGYVTVEGRAEYVNPTVAAFLKQQAGADGENCDINSQSCSPPRVKLTAQDDPGWRGQAGTWFCLRAAGCHSEAAANRGYESQGSTHLHLPARQRRCASMGNCCTSS